MARLKLIVKRTKIEFAKGKRTCKFSGASIQKGDICLVVTEERDRCYSPKIAGDMIKLARERLDLLEQALNARVPLD
jgi:hypothetical protein